MREALYYEDFEVGQQFKSSEDYMMDMDAVIAFAHEFDPQPMHLDKELAKESAFGQLVASGWHTAAATMRLKTRTDLHRIAGGLVGLGIDGMRWPRPTLPGDSLRIVVTVLDKRLSNSRPGQGIVKYKVETFNQRNELAMEMTTAVIVPLRGK